MGPDSIQRLHSARERVRRSFPAGRTESTFRQARRTKKIGNHEHVVTLHYMDYNFGRMHRTFRVTPAMEARVADHVWGLEEIANLMDERV
jgi:hypothetical protein